MCIVDDQDGNFFSEKLLLEADNLNAQGKVPVLIVRKQQNQVFVGAM